MAALSNNGKESFELLRGSFDSNSTFSDTSEILFPTKKKRYRRRLKNNPSIQHEESAKECHCRMRTLGITLFYVISFCWLIILTWLTVVLHSELNRLTSHVSRERGEHYGPRLELPLNEKMNSITHVNVPLQAGKKMKKRKELDALVAKAMAKRNGEGVKRSSSAAAGLNSHDKLLSESTDEADYWTPPAVGKPRCPRRAYLVRNRACFTFLKMCSVVLVFACVVATTAVMWLFVDVREQVASLRTELNQVVAGNQGVPDALQKCHSLSKDLQKNQTLIMSRLYGFSLQLANFSSEMAEVKSGLEAVQNQLRSSPDLVNIPRLIKDLSASVASIGSQIRDLNSTVSTLKDQNGKLDKDVAGLVNNITETKMKLVELSKSDFGKGELTEKKFVTEKEALLALINQVSREVSTLNQTITNKLRWTTDVQSKDHKLIESLQEMNANVTARLKTLEILCAKETEYKLLNNKYSGSSNVGVGSGSDSDRGDAGGKHEFPEPSIGNIKNESGKDSIFSSPDFLNSQPATESKKKDRPRSNAP